MITPRLQCTFRHEVLTYDDLEYICVVDEDVGRSVTNDARAVIEFLRGTSHGLGFRPVLCQDTQGQWDGLAHDGQAFTGFYPIGAESLADAIEAIPTPEPSSIGYDPRS